MDESDFDYPTDEMGINLVDGFLMIVAGRSNTGKSHFIRWLFSELRDDLDYGVVFSNTAFEGSFDYIPPRYVFEEFSEPAIQNLIKIQKDMLVQAEAKYKRAIKKGKLESGDPNPYKKRAFVLLDDCCSENEFHSATLKKLAVQGRHYNIVTVLSTQYIHLIPPVIRANCNYGVFFDVGLGKREVEATYEWIGGMFPSFNAFKKFYNEHTRNHQFILFHKDDQEYKIFLAPAEIPKFQLKFRKDM